MKKTYIIAAFAVMLLIAGCGTKEQELAPEVTPTQAAVLTEAPKATVTPAATATPEPTATSTPAPTPEADWYAEMIEASLVSSGNNARLKKVLEKARSGEQVHIALLGGSITEGAGATKQSDGYAYQFARAFAETYGNGDNINVVNAGLSGTPSCLGAIRFQKDVVDVLGAEPDLLVLEFAVNDWQEATGTRAYEGLIHDVLSQESDAAVILLFAVSKSKWNVQDSYLPIGKYYDLPMVSIKDAIVEPYKTKHLSDVIFFKDDYHPTTYGHKMMSECLMNLLAVVDAEEADKPLAVPETGKRGLEFKHVVLLIDEKTAEEHIVEIRMKEGQEDKVFTILSFGYTE